VEGEIKMKKLLSALVILILMSGCMRDATTGAVPTTAVQLTIMPTAVPPTQTATPNTLLEAVEELQTQVAEEPKIVIETAVPPTATAATILTGLAKYGISGLTPYVFTGSEWGCDVYLPIPNPVGFGTGCRPWKVTIGDTNLVWLLGYFDTQANGPVTVTVTKAYEVTGTGSNVIWLTYVKLDNRAQEQLKDRNDPNAAKSPYDVACNGDVSGQCKLNGSRLSLYLDKGSYSVLLADGSWQDMSTDWKQVLLPPKGDEQTFVLAIKLGINGNFRFHIGGAEVGTCGCWHNSIEIPTQVTMTYHSYPTRG
jgi:hypothetical protein